MGSPSIDAAPPPPDYAEANREGIYTDIETLPIRRQIDQASRLGQRIEYLDPNTGQMRVADFSGLGDIALARQAADLASQTNADIQRQQLALRQELGLANARQTAEEVRAADPLAYDTRQDLTGILRQSLNQDPPQFRDEASTQRLSDIYAQATQANDPALFAGLREQVAGLPRDTDSAQRLGDIYSQATQVTDPALLSGLRQQLGALAPRDTTGEIADLRSRALGLRTTADDPSSAALTLGLQRAVEDYNRGGALDPNVRRELLNEARAAQAARGNFLGDAAALVEAQELGSAMEQRQAQRLATLLDVQGRAFGQNSALRAEEAALQQAQLGALAGLQQQGYTQSAADRAEIERRIAGQAALQQQQVGNLGVLAGLQQQAYGQGAADRAEALQRIGTQAGLVQQQMGNLGMLGQLQQQAFGQNQATDATNYGRRQQTLANVSAMVLGQPITNQFGALGSAQQGAVGYTPVNFQGGPTLNANAGNQAAQFAQQGYGTASSNWSKMADIQSQGSPWMSLVGNVAGAAAGAML